ncbi:RNA polymerase subunit sigma-70 [Lachnospiraceae bacterium 47-T17]
MTEEQKQQVIRLRKEGCGYTAVAHNVGVSKDTVKSFCRRNGLAGKLAVSANTQATGCRECGRPLQQTEGMKQRVFCCDVCRVKWWHAHPEKIKQRAVYAFTCAGCGKPFTAYGNSKRKYCSHGCYVRSRFKGGDEGA